MNAAQRRKRRRFAVRAVQRLIDRMEGAVLHRHTQQVRQELEEQGVDVEAFLQRMRAHVARVRAGRRP